MSKIQDYDKIYALAKPFVALVYRLFYSKVEIKLSEPLPYEAPLIFAPNHQNALMDALSVLQLSDRQVVFVARADIFNKPVIRKILTGLKIMPVHRIRDGYKNLLKNDETFEKAVEVLADHVPFCIMPEGNHGDKHRMRPFVKGIFRIALQTQEAVGLQQGVKIIPVGIEYSDYTAFRSQVLIQTGKAIEVSEYAQAYAENPAQTINELRDRLSHELSPVMIDIRSEVYYDEIMLIKEMYRPVWLHLHKLASHSLVNRFTSDKAVIALLDNDEVQLSAAGCKLMASARNYRYSLENLNMSDADVKQARNRLQAAIYLILTLLLMPLGMLCATVNLPLYLLNGKLLSMLKDEQFKCTVKFMVMLLFALPLYLLITLTTGLITGSAIMATGVFAFCLVSAFIAHTYWQQWKRTLKQIHLFMRSSLLRTLQSQRFTVLDQMHAIWHEYAEEKTKKNEAE